MSVLNSIVDAIRQLVVGPMSQEALAVALDQRASIHSEKLDWRNSIVDLMKLTGQDSSLQAREQLAQELGYQGKLDGSAAMNIWLHTEVMRRLATSGGIYGNR